ncbi:MAG TPA: PilZ domain-containing protein [Candidatus Acidoferrales bacterium]|nr:PilZ domain-containing protein [Candidatus Acidoferrales bacterium]
MGNSVTWNELGIDSTQNRRRESRRSISIPIQVTGFAKDGKFFAEQTVTANISESGCSFRLHKELERGGVIAIKILTAHHFHALPDESLLYQVVYATKDATGWSIGTAKLQEESVWSALNLVEERRAS